MIDIGIIKYHIPWVKNSFTRYLILVSYEVELNAIQKWRIVLDLCPFDSPIQGEKTEAERLLDSCYFSTKLD